MGGHDFAEVVCGGAVRQVAHCALALADLGGLFCQDGERLPVELAELGQIDGVDARPSSRRKGNGTPVVQSLLPQPPLP